MTHSPLQIGDLAPSFGSWEDSHRTQTPQDLSGKWIVLYFYPKDNTSGCTKEALDFKDLYPEFSALDCCILGISKDSLSSHEKFRSSFSLPFPLISDPTGSVCEAYGTWVEKSMYGRKYFGIERSTFLLNSDHKIVHIWRKVKVPNHAQEVLNTLQAALS